MDKQSIIQYKVAFDAIATYIEGENGQQTVEVWFARDLQSQLGYEDADKYSTWCDCIPKYAEGLELFNKEKYKESLEYLKDCADADYLDSKELYDKADKYQYYEEDYQAALKLYNAGKYYSAKVAFEKLGDYKDSAKKAESCVR